MQEKGIGPVADRDAATDEAIIGLLVEDRGLWHTFASLHLRCGTNLLQLSRALGHHSPAFTLTRYTHLLPGDEAPALNLP